MRKPHRTLFIGGRSLGTFSSKPRQERAGSCPAWQTQDDPRPAALGHQSRPLPSPRMPHAPPFSSWQPRSPCSTLAFRAAASPHFSVSPPPPFLQWGGSWGRDLPLFQGCPGGARGDSRLPGLPPPRRASPGAKREQGASPWGRRPLRAKASPLTWICLLQNHRSPGRNRLRCSCRRPAGSATAARRPPLRPPGSAPVPPPPSPAPPSSSSPAFAQRLARRPTGRRLQPASLRRAPPPMLGRAGGGRAGGDSPLPSPPPVHVGTHQPSLPVARRAGRLRFGLPAASLA